MTTEQARQILTENIKVRVLNGLDVLPEKDIVFTRLTTENSIEEWTFVGLIKLIYNLRDINLISNLKANAFASLFTSTPPAFFALPSLPIFKFLFVVVPCINQMIVRYVFRITSFHLLNAVMYPNYIHAFRYRPSFDSEPVTNYG